jgi:hypothetical protein
VLDFNISEAVELCLVPIGDKAEGIEEAKRRLRKTRRTEC